jgi:hypothetical protein
MMIKRAACLAFTAACLTAIATLPAAHAQTAYGAPPTGDPGGNSMGLPGPNPGGPGLTPYNGGAPGATQPYPAYPTAPSAAGTSNTEMVTNGLVTYPPQPPGWSPRKTSSKASITPGCWSTTARFATRVSAGSVGRSPTRNCTSSASRASPNTRPVPDLRPPMARRAQAVTTAAAPDGERIIDCQGPPAPGGGPCGISARDRSYPGRFLTRHCAEQERLLRRSLPRG